MTVVDSTRFFLGANTPNGFRGFHQTDLYDAQSGWVAFLIKSGAGTGKATFMREVLTFLNAQNIETEALYCSSDPSSLDAVIAPSLKLCVMDATSPHIVEPVAYGECEQLVPFGCCLQPEITLAQTDAWFDAADACRSSHARCCRFLSAAFQLLENNRSIARNAMLKNKIDTAAKRLIARECDPSHIANGKESRRFLSAVTPQGYLFFADTAARLCPKLYVLEDEYGAVSERFITSLRYQLMQTGYDILSCFDPLAHPSIPSHLLIPSLGVGILTSDSLHPVSFPVYRRMHATRFTDAAFLQGKKQQLRFNRRASKEMISQAVEAMADAKQHHDRMEALHISAMDWDLWRQTADTAMACIRKITATRV